jgi:hypothetical protein
VIGAVALGLALLAPAGVPVDDPGPCPAGTYEWLPAGADYQDDTWFVDGVAFGHAAEEDECWTPVAAWVTVTPQQVRIEQAIEDLDTPGTRLPATR